LGKADFLDFPAAAVGGGSNVLWPYKPCARVAPLHHTATWQNTNFRAVASSQPRPMETSAWKRKKMILKCCAAVSQV